tara:strand:+ start:431 stop:1558 length:1128 start_codon:yes stop_codon:yes gene_type:complete
MHPEIEYYLIRLRHKIKKIINQKFDPYPKPPESVYLSPSEYHKTISETVPLQLNWNTGKYDDPIEWQDIVQNKLIELLKIPKERPKTQIIESQESIWRDRYNRVKCYLRSDVKRDVPVNIFWKGLLPHKPIIICLQGANFGAHLSWGEYLTPNDPRKISGGSTLALQAADRGYVAVCVEQSCFGERRELKLKKVLPNPTTDAANHALLLGRTLLGEMVSDVMSVVDWLISDGSGLNVDTKEIFIMGYSLGGTVAITTGAVDKRISGVAVGGCISSFTSLFKRGIASTIIPDVLTYFDYDAIIGLLAPRYCLVLSGDKDHIFPYDGAEPIVKNAMPVFKSLNARNKIKLVKAIGPHKYYPDLMWNNFEELVQQYAA